MDAHVYCGRVFDTMTPSKVQVKRLLRKLFTQLAPATRWAGGGVARAGPAISLVSLRRLGEWGRNPGKQVTGRAPRRSRGGLRPAGPSRHGGAAQARWVGADCVPAPSYRQGRARNLPCLQEFLTGPRDDRLLCSWLLGGCVGEWPTTSGGRRRPAERPPPEGASVAYAQEVLALLRTAKGLLAPDGVLFLLDPLFAPGQSRAARFLVSKDRGQNIRTEEGYAALCGREFPTCAPMSTRLRCASPIPGSSSPARLPHRLTDEGITDE